MPERLIDDLSAIAREAGALALARAGEAFERWEKTPGNPVCAIDLEVNDLLRKRLTALDPQAGWLSEETADDRTRLDRRRLWVVDPIDGTRDYIHGRPGWAVSVALIENGLPVLGVLDAPARDEHWRAIRGLGATRNAQPIAVTPRLDFAGARVPADHLPKVDQDLVAVHKPNGIALRMAMVAAGEADLVASIRWGHEWDVAAAALIVEEAGGTVTDALGQPLRFNAYPPRAFGLLATAPGIHRAAVNRLKERVEAAIG